MSLTYVLIQNLRRSPLRTILTGVAFALPMAIFVAAISMVANLRLMAAANEKELRLAVTNRVTLINLLPEGMRRQIEELDPEKSRITAVCGMRWFGGRRPNSQDMLTALASDVDTFPVVYSEVGMTPAEIEQWQRERRAAVIGGNLAREFKWKLGDLVSLESSIPPYLSLPFVVVKIMPEEAKANLLYFRRDYLEESLKAANFTASGCNIFWVKARNSQALHELQKIVDDRFAHSSNETQSQDENAFINNFVQSSGDLPGLFQAMSLVVVLIITMIGGNTVMMSFRERVGELAVFKAIGFHSSRVFLLVLGESLLLALGGSLAGIVPVSLLLWAFPVRGTFLGGMGSLTISPFGVIGALVLAGVIGFLAGVWPAYQALRLKTVDALRTAG